MKLIQNSQSPDRCLSFREPSTTYRPWSEACLDFVRNTEGRIAAAIVAAKECSGYLLPQHRETGQRNSSDPTCTVVAAEFSLASGVK